MARYDPDTLSALRRTADRMADAASDQTLRYFRSGRDATDKGANGYDPVTEGDRAAERAMRAVLAEMRPQDAILGEEYGAQEGRSGLTWVLDPIDGTRAYLAGAPTWGTLVAVSDEEGPIMGLIDQPHVGERFWGGPAGATLRHGDLIHPLKTAPTARLGDAILMTTFPEVGSPAEGAAFASLAAEVRLTRYGLDCYAYGLVAMGQADLVVEAGLAAYDIQGPLAVVRAAGGVVTDWEGGPAHDGGRVIAAATPALHEAALRHLSGTP